MPTRRPLPRLPRLLRTACLLSAVAATVGSSTLLTTPLSRAYASGSLTPGNLLVSTSLWATDAAITSGTTQLPPGCSTATGAPNPCATAIAGGSYPYVFNNDAIDSSFGVTQPIVLDQLNPANGQVLSTLTVPNSLQAGVTSSSDQLVTSFSSKSEIALNQSTDGNDVTFMGYVAPVGTIDASNSNTPGDVDPTNTGPTSSYYRAVAQLDQNSNFQFTETNAYSGNNGRAAILNPGNDSIYTVGNAGNGGNPEPQGVVVGSGAQIFTPASQPESAQTPGQPTPLGNFNVRELGLAADKSAKDNNFRGLTFQNNVIYATKGSGSNGVDTVYFVDTSGGACPGGSGVPATNAALPSASTFVSPTFSTNNAALGLTTSNPGLTPTNMCVLNGFPTSSAKNANDASDYPFGIWFANPTTLYVADEGAGDNAYLGGTYTAAAASTTAGLQKWTLNSATGTWTLDYTLQNGLNLGTPYSVASSGGNSYPTGTNSYPGSKGTTVTGPWEPANDGLRNLTGQVNANGTVTLWATTSTVSYDGDQGADPNSLVSITDDANAIALPPSESFSTVMAPHVRAGYSRSLLRPGDQRHATGPDPRGPVGSTHPNLGGRGGCRVVATVSPPRTTEPGAVGRLAPLSHREEETV